MTEINYFKEKETVFPEEEKKLKRQQEKLEKKHKKLQNRVRLKEVKKALLGNLTIGEDGRMVPVSGFNMNWWGTADGSFGTRLFGIAEKTVTFTSSKGKTKMVYEAAKVMEDFGRGLDFESVYAGASCLLRHFLFRPVVLVFEADEEAEGEYMLSVYCGRDILTYFSMRRAIRLFETHKPEGLVPIERKTSKDKG